MFVVLGTTAFLLHLFVRLLAFLNFPALGVAALEGVAIALFGVDVLIFARIQARIVYRAFKEMNRK